ncbi:hypothetical protein GOBAR_DD33790 [Gossypium barbadense]|nr:hypothetical protein GOBAR_DD33790 [Gossypium barbadense]
MSEREEDYDSDAPEEFSNQQGIKQDENIRKIQKENKASFGYVLAAQDIDMLLPGLNEYLVKSPLGSWDCLENAVVVCFAAIFEKDGDWYFRIQ